jgi:hypothetical protein
VLKFQKTLYALGPGHAPYGNNDPLENSRPNWVEKSDETQRFADRALQNRRDQQPSALLAGRLQRGSANIDLHLPQRNL